MSRMRFANFAWFRCCFKTLAVFTLISSLELSKASEAPFVPHDSSVRLNNFVFSEKTNAFYISGVNHIYQVTDVTRSVKNSLRNDSSNNIEIYFRQDYDTKTGPKLDSVNCHATGCGPDHEDQRQLTNNTNKILLVDSENQNLIACGSVFQGSCFSYSLDDISNVEDRRFLPEAVGANDETSSTFAFIGPQRYNRWGHGNVVYVGTSYTSGPYRHDVPAISSRNLYDLKLAEFSFSKQSLVNIDVKVRDRFPVKYVHGFNASNYVYFLTVQKKSHMLEHEHKGFESRLIRFCASDSNFDTYTEISIQCDSMSEDVDFVATNASFDDNQTLFVSFNAHGKQQIPSNVCQYSIFDINRVFDENIKACLNGTVKLRNLDYISGMVQEGKCPDGSISHSRYSYDQATPNICETALKISGSIPLRNHVSFQATSGEKVTSIEHVTISDQSFVFLGMSNGRIRLTVNSNSKLETIKVFSVSSSEDPIIKISAISSDKFSTPRVYFLTPTRFSRLPVWECDSKESTAKTCNACMERQNPFCGWCMSKQRCMSKNQCVNDFNNKISLQNQWIFSSPTSSRASEQCLHLIKSIPSVVVPSNKGPRNIRLYIQGVERLQNTVASQNKPLVCRFSSQSSSTQLKSSMSFDASIHKDGVACPNPLYSGMSVPEDVESIKIKLTFSDSQFNILPEPVNLEVFECGRQKQCQSCINPSSNMKCVWCMSTNTCVSADQRGKSSEVHITQCSSSPLQQVSQCPRLEQHRRLTTKSSSQQLFPSPFDISRRHSNHQSPPTNRVANGHPSQLSLKFVEKLPHPYANAHFICVIKIGDETRASVIKLPALLSPTRQLVRCDRHLFTFEAKQYEKVGEVSVAVKSESSDQDYVILDSTSFVIFKCEYVGQTNGQVADCSTCKSPKNVIGSECAWCSGSCRFTQYCEKRGELASSCPAPKITSISPPRGPVSGGTRLIVHGSDLDVRGRVKVFIGDRLCQDENQSSTSSSSLQITCVVPAQEKTGLFEVKLFSENNLVLNTQPDHIKQNIVFEYAEYIIHKESIYPNAGPISGGTVLTISGSNLGIGSHREISLDDIPCIEVGQQKNKGKKGDENDLIQNTNTIIRCVVTPKYHKSMSITNSRFNDAKLDDATDVALHINSLGNNQSNRRHQYRRFSITSGDRPTGMLMDSQLQDSSFTTHSLILQVDEATRTVPFKFRFTPDPVIRQIKPLRSYVSGGRLISVHGQHFSPIQTSQLVIHLPRSLRSISPFHHRSNNQDMTVEYDSRKSSSPRYLLSEKCDVINDRLMECATPNLPFPMTIDYPQSFETGLIFSNKSFVRHPLLFLNRDHPELRSDVFYVPDPKFFNFTDTVNGRRRVLIIRGQGLTGASNANDIRVEMLNENRYVVDICNVTSLADSRIICVPSKQSPTSSSSTAVAQVLVRVGRHLEFPVGVMQQQYALRSNNNGQKQTDNSLTSSSSSSFFSSSEVWGGVAAACVVVILSLILVVFAFTFFKKSSNGVSSASGGFIVGVGGDSDANLCYNTSILKCTFNASPNITAHHYSSKANSETVKHLRQRMDALLLNSSTGLRDACQRSFSQLQSDLIDLHTSSSSIEEQQLIPLENGQHVISSTYVLPSWDFRTYLYRSLFPFYNVCTMECNAVVNSDNNNGENVISSNTKNLMALQSMERLIMNGDFIMNLVLSVDSNSDISCRDRVQLAALISSLLCSNMSFYSSVVKRLLMSSSSSSNVSDKNQQVVVNRLIMNWLSICLFDHVQSLIGPRIHMLYRALKWQVERGPVDMITHKSRFALSPDRLLTSQPYYDYSVVTCLVLLPPLVEDESTNMKEANDLLLEDAKQRSMQSSPQQAFETQVLDCDSISQVKSKLLDALYRLTPYTTGRHSAFALSSSCTSDSIDLEWHCSQEAKVVLQDFDLTSRQTVVPVNSHKGSSYFPTSKVRTNDSLFEPNNSHVTSSFTLMSPPKSSCNSRRRILKQANTFRHYGIQDRVVLSLVPKPSSSHKVRETPGDGSAGLGGGGSNNAIYSYADEGASSHYAELQSVYGGVFPPSSDSNYYFSPSPLISSGNNNREHVASGVLPNNVILLQEETKQSTPKLKHNLFSTINRYTNQTTLFSGGLVEDEIVEYHLTPSFHHQKHVGMSHQADGFMMSSLANVQSSSDDNNSLSEVMKKFRSIGSKNSGTSSPLATGMMPSSTTGSSSSSCSASNYSASSSSSSTKSSSVFVTKSPILSRLLPSQSKRKQHHMPSEDMYPPAYENSDVNSSINPSGDAFNASDVNLSRLLETRGVVSSFIDDVIHSMLSVTATDRFPCSIKWLFDILDESFFQQSRLLSHSPLDPFQCADSSNSLNSQAMEAQKRKGNVLTQFYSALVSHPDIVYDVNVDQSQTSILQSMTDVSQVLSEVGGSDCQRTHCVSGEERMSNTSQALFHHDILSYGQMSEQFVSDVKNLPNVSPTDFEYHMDQLSVRNASSFTINRQEALRQVNSFVDRSYTSLVQRLRVSSRHDLIDAMDNLTSINCLPGTS